MFFRSTPSCCFPKPDSGPGSNYLTHTCTLLTSSFLSTTFPLTIFFFRVVRILFLKHHFHHTPPPAAPSCIKSKLQVLCSKAPFHCLGHYLLYSWTPLQPSKRPDTMSIQCYNIWLIQSTLSDLQLIIWMFCLQDAKHLDWLKKFTTLIETFLTELTRCFGIR